MADQAEITRNSHPLSRIVICCTSVLPDARQILAKKAQDMGARHVLDLTSDVTHLVCEDITTPKYRYVAKMRTDVKVMMAGWVDAMYDPWIDGEDINPHDFEEKFKLPILYKLSISVTGILDGGSDISNKPRAHADSIIVADRKKIEELVNDHGASYHPDLTRHVTHLIAAAPTGKKYEFATNNNISAVTVEWLHESLERGMALEESCYDPRLPKEKLGIGARPALSTVTLVEPLPEVHGKRKIRKRAEYLLGSQSQGLWGDILGQASNPKPMKRDEWEDNLHTYNAKRVSKNIPKGLARNAVQPAVRAEIKTGIMALCTFYIYGFTKKQAVTVHNILLSYDANIISSFQALKNFQDSSRLFVVVPVSMRKRECPDVSSIGNVSIVTEWWIEACMHKSRLIDPSDGFTFSSYEDYPLEGFQGMEICLTQFTGIELLHLRKLITLLGGTFDEILSKKRNLLVTSLPAKGDKFDFAIHNDIPVVTAEWFQECLKESKAVPFKRFLVHGGGRKSRTEKPVPAENPGSAKRAIAEAGDSRDDKRPRLSGVNFQGGKLLGENLQSFGDRLRGGKPGKNTGADTDEKTSGPPSNDRDTKDREVQVRIRGYGQESKGKGVLDECVICVSKKLKAHRVELNSVAKSLGATIIDSFSPDGMNPITHLIHSSKTPRDSTKDLKIANTIYGCHVVSPDWLYKCKESENMVDEKAYPPIIAPRKGLEMEFANNSSSSLSPVPTSELQMPLEPKVKVKQNEPIVDNVEEGPGFVSPQGDDGDDDNLNDIHRTINPESTPPTSAPVSTLPLQLSSRKPSLTIHLPSSDSREISDPPSAKSSSGIGDILGKLGKGEITSAMEKRKRPRGKLQGRATSNLSSYNNLSRASSAEPSRAGSVPPSQQGHKVRESRNMNAPSKQHGPDMIPAPSQAIRYEDPEAEKERKSVRAKLSGDTVGLETPKPMRGTRKVKTAVDVEGSVRRGRRNR